MFEKGSLERQVLFAGVAFCILALLFGLWSHYNWNEPPAKELTLKTGTAFPIPRQIQPFTLDNGPNNLSFTNAQLKGQWSMLFFGFTNCAMLCPTTLGSLNQVYNNLVTDKISQLPQVYFISIDPERDSVKRIKQYVTSFNKSFDGATGTEAQLEDMTHKLNILYSKSNPNQAEDYQIDHSGTVLVIDPDGNLAALFSPPIDPKGLAQDYELLIKQSHKGN
ncbi:MAG: SCO family protein [Gammaproteobacteria bacterium]|nr:SCO family protein [Gammaproteobacteria bacterium]